MFKVIQNQIQARTVIRIAAKIRTGNKNATFIPVLIRALGHEDYTVHLLVIKALAAIGAPAVPALITALADRQGNVEVRCGAALVLGDYMRAPAAVPALIEALREREPTRVRTYAIWALGGMKAHAAVPILLAVLRDGHEGRDIRSGAAYALGRIGGPDATLALVQALRDGTVRDSAVKALGTTATPAAAIPALFEVLKEKHEDAGFRAYAARALGLMKDPFALPVLLEALNDSHEHTGVRSGAARASGDIQDPAALPALILALHGKAVNGAMDVRVAAAYALGDLQKPVALPALIALLRNKQENPKVRACAAQALEKIKDPVAIPALVEALTEAEQNEFTRQCAASALVEMRPPAALDALLDAIRNEDSRVRDSAVRFAGRINNPAAAIRVLSATLRDVRADNAIRASAAEALGQISIGQIIMRNVEFRVPDLAAIPVLREARKDPARTVREVAARALSSIAIESRSR